MIKIYPNDSQGSYNVTLYLSRDGDSIELVRGVSKEKAKKVYEQIKKELQSKGEFIEIETGENVEDCDEVIRFIPKKAVSHIKFFDP